MVSNKGNISRYVNKGYTSIPQTDLLEGLSDVTVSNNNGILRCQFNREKYSEGDNYYNLFSSAYVLLAKGSLSGSNRNFVSSAVFDHN